MTLIFFRLFAWSVSALGVLSPRSRRSTSAVAAVSATPCHMSLRLPVFDALGGAPGGVPRARERRSLRLRLPNFAFVNQGRGRTVRKQRFRVFRTVRPRVWYTYANSPPSEQQNVIPSSRGTPLGAPTRAPNTSRNSSIRISVSETAERAHF